MTSCVRVCVCVCACVNTLDTLVVCLHKPHVCMCVHVCVRVCVCGAWMCVCVCVYMLTLTPLKCSWSSASTKLSSSPGMSSPAMNQPRSPGLKANMWLSLYTHTHTHTASSQQSTNRADQGTAQAEDTHACARHLCSHAALHVGHLISHDQCTRHIMHAVALAKRAQDTRMLSM